jgi:hypothetical protein
MPLTFARDFLLHTVLAPSPQTTRSRVAKRLSSAFGISEFSLGELMLRIRAVYLVANRVSRFSFLACGSEQGSGMKPPRAEDEYGAWKKKLVVEKAPASNFVSTGGTASQVAWSNFCSTAPVFCFHRPLLLRCVRRRCLLRDNQILAGSPNNNICFGLLLCPRPGERRRDIRRVQEKAQHMTFGFLLLASAVSALPANEHARAEFMHAKSGA